MKRQGLSGFMILVLLAAAGGGYYMMQEDGSDLSLPSDIRNIVDAGGGACSVAEQYYKAVNQSNIGNAESVVTTSAERVNWEGSLGSVSCSEKEMEDEQRNAVINNIEAASEYNVTDVAKIEVTYDLCGEDYSQGNSTCITNTEHTNAAKTPDGWKYHPER